MQRIACHIQIFALSIWLPVTLPVEYYEFAKGLQWSIPYLRLPWEDEHDRPDLSGYSPFAGSNPYLSKTRHLEVLQNKVPGNNITMVDQLYGLPLTPMEYRSFFEVTMNFIFSCSNANERGTCFYIQMTFYLQNQNIKPQADNIFGAGSYSQ